MLLTDTSCMENPVEREPRSTSTKGRGSNLERVLWTAFFLVLIGGGGWWSTRSWFQSSRQESSQLTLPPLILVTFTPNPQTPESQPAQSEEDTATPSSLLEADEAFTQTPRPQASTVVTATMTVTPALSSTPEPSP